MVTKSASPLPPCPLFSCNDSSQMPGPLSRGLALRDRKPDRGPDRDPIGVFTRDVAAVDDIDRKNFVGPIANTGLKPWPDHAGDVGCAGLAERLDRPLQDIGEFPVETEAVGQIMSVDGAVPQPATIDVDPHG